MTKRALGLAQLGQALAGLLQQHGRRYHLRQLFGLLHGCVHTLLQILHQQMLIEGGYRLQGRRLGDVKAHFAPILSPVA